MTATTARATSASPLAELASSRGLRIVFVLLGMWLVLGVHPETREAFLTSGNFSNLTAQVAEIVVIGVGMTLVVLTGGIDLSVGAGMALAGVVAARLQIEMHQPAWIAVLAAVLVSGVVGAWHGLLVTRLSIPPFIATLSGFLAYRGAAVVLSGARGLAPMGEDFQKLGGRLPPFVSLLLTGVACTIGIGLVLRRVSRRRALGLSVMSNGALGMRIGAILVLGALCATIYREGAPVPVLIAVVAAALGAVVLRKTRLGRYAYAIGGNQEAARLSGVPVAKVTMAIYVATGVLTALAGIIATARTNGVTPATTGLTRELSVVTAVVIGGTSLSGGRGTLVGTLIGALVIGTLQNGMNLMGVNSNWQSIVTGQILLGAALLDVLSSKSDLSPRTKRVAMTAFGLVVAAALVAVVARGKTNDKAGANGPIPGAERPRVAFLLSTLQEERYQKDQKYFEAKAKALGIEAFTLAADNDNGKQLAELEDALSRGAKIVVIQPTDSVAAASYVERAHAHGAKVVAYDRGIKSDALDYYVAHDSFAVGKMIADAAVEATGGKGNFVLLDGQAGHSVANEIGRGVHSVLDPLVAKGDVKIVVEQTHDSWSPEQSLQTVQDAIAKTRGDIQAILAHNSGMARGAVQGLAAAGLGPASGKKIFIGGADADAANVNYVCEGKQSVEILKDIAPLAEKAVLVAAALARGEQVDAARTPGSSAPTVSVPVHLVTRENAKKLLVDSGFHAASAVPACK
jgi:ABC-type xylose transport system permease subunit/ABC-type xylose transport system substrate-binding protein